MEHICCAMGHFYQVQNDFLDCFSDASNSVLKKPGTDIEDGKCTWLAVKAMENGTGHQKAIMETCYGRDGMHSDLDLSKLKLALSGFIHCLFLVSCFLFLCCIDADCVNRVKQVYNDLELAELYSHYEEEIYKSIKQQIEQFSRSHDFPPDILIKTLDRTFNRV